ncbi:MAG: VRR-NUC domain-containing protein [Caulobacteraceae bacterium]|nr:VRR-NUC domain-containing protein [Caulobacteraceae bacterium]
MLERTIVAKVIATAKSLGWFAVKIHGNAYQMAGLPDVLCIKGGRAVWMEAKVPGNEPSPIQVRRMKELAAAGCPCAVVFSDKDARKFLEECV